MYIKVCDRCGRVTNNRTAFLIPTTKDNGSYQIDSVWFGDPVVLCNFCLKEFRNFRYTHESFNHNLATDNNFKGEKE